MDVYACPGANLPPPGGHAAKPGVFRSLGLPHFDSEFRCFSPPGGLQNGRGLKSVRFSRQQIEIGPKRLEPAEALAPPKYFQKYLYEFGEPSHHLCFCLQEK